MLRRKVPVRRGAEILARRGADVPARRGNAVGYRLAPTFRDEAMENTTIAAVEEPRVDLKPTVSRPHPILKGILLGFLALLTAIGAIVVFSYIHFSRIIDEQLKAGPFSTTASIYAAPRILSLGQQISIDEIIASLRRAGYEPKEGTSTGWFAVRPGEVEIHPGPDSYFSPDAARIQATAGKITAIRTVKDGRAFNQYQLEPPLITAVAEDNREKRRLVKFDDIPGGLVHALVSVEDKRFFEHNGFDPMRIVKAAWVDFRSHRKEQGASTLSMQLARNFWLEPDKSWKRKFAEMCITMRLEERLSKKQIFEDYSNQVYLGRVGTYSINGFGEGARAFFGKDIKQLNVPEAATLAGMVQRPSYYNPFRNPDRVVERRNVVLSLMKQNKYINQQEYEEAVRTPLKLSTRDLDVVDAPYFIDLVNDELQGETLDQQANGGRVYTTIDLDLQRAAADAVRMGMQYVDEQLRKKAKSGKPNSKKAEHAAVPASGAQVALVAIDPHTGEIKALVGGRNYTASQLNHALAKRQPGSVFKPFVYAAALNTAVEGGNKLFTPASVVVDEPTAFNFGNQVYQPGNFHNAFYGAVTLRRALAHSMNIATIKVAQMVGFDGVVTMARRAGLNEDIKATPAVALGAYEATPLEMAGAYTVFANRGNYVKPSLISTIRAHDATVIYTHRVEQRPALDPRVAYLMVDMLQEVMRSGTAAGVRSRGFKAPAAGKTGTSHDGWFAGFTSDLLCVVWVGFDDNRELNLEGARSALPIWTEFMKRALQYYFNARPFPRPEGISSVAICPESGMLRPNSVRRALRKCSSGAPSPAKAVPCIPELLLISPDGDRKTLSASRASLSSSSNFR